MKELKVRVDYTPLKDAIEEFELSENQIFKQWGIQRKTFFNIRHGQGLTVDTLARLSVILNKDISQLVDITYDIIDNPEEE